MRPGIFLDRDGVVNENRLDHVKDWSEFQFLPGALEALRRLAALDLPVVVVTNQSIIGRGLATQDAVEDINRRMLAEVEAAGGRIAGIWYCPHAPDDGCACRKPAPGLLVAAAKALDLDLGRSFMIGDAITDIQAAQAVGVFPVMVRTGRGALACQETGSAHSRPDLVIVDDLQAAVDWVYDAIMASEVRPA